MTESEMTLRLATAADERELRRLASLDTAPVPPQPALVASQDGALVAAISLRDLSEVADPFRHSTTARELLRLRAAHLVAASAAKPRLRRLGSLLGRLGSRSCASLAGSPPAAGGRLLDLGR